MSFTTLSDDEERELHGLSSVYWKEARRCKEAKDEDTAAAISAVSQGSTGSVRIRMHNKLRALVALGTSECSTSARRTVTSFMPSLTSP
jgi:hypothetical protein